MDIDPASFKHSPETRAKISASLKAYYATHKPTGRKPAATKLTPEFLATIPTAEEWAAQQAKLAGQPTTQPSAPRHQ